MMVLMGVKRTKSETFQYRQKTAVEIEEELLLEQKNTLNNLEKSLSENQKQQQEFEKIQQEIQRKKKKRLERSEKSAISYKAPTRI